MFNWECVKIHLLVNPDEVSIEPLHTFNWTPTHFHLNPRSTLKWAWNLILIFFLLVKAINLKNVFSCSWSKLNSQLGNPFKTCYLNFSWAHSRFDLVSTIPKGGRSQGHSQWATFFTSLVSYCPTLHCSTLHYTTIHCSTLHYTTLHYTTLRYTTLHYTTLHYTTLLYTTLHYTTLTLEVLPVVVG